MIQTVRNNLRTLAPLALFALATLVLPGCVGTRPYRPATGAADAAPVSTSVHLRYGIGHRYHYKHHHGYKKHHHHKHGYKKHHSYKSKYRSSKSCRRGRRR